MNALIMVLIGIPAFCAHLAPHLPRARYEDPRWWWLLIGTVNVLGGNYRRARNGKFEHRRMTPDIETKFIAHRKRAGGYGAPLVMPGKEGESDE